MLFSFLIGWKSGASFSSKSGRPNNNAKPKQRRTTFDYTCFLLRKQSTSVTTLNSNDHPQTWIFSATVELFTVTCFSTDIAGANTILKSVPEMIGVTCTSSVPRLKNNDNYEHSSGTLQTEKITSKITKLYKMPRWVTLRIYREWTLPLTLECCCVPS